MSVVERARTIDQLAQDTAQGLSLELLPGERIAFVVICEAEPAGTAAISWRAVNCPPHLCPRALREVADAIESGKSEVRS